MTDDPDVPLFPYKDLLGFRILAWAPDFIRLGLTAEARHLDETGRVDAGVLTSLLDAATGLSACHCAVPGNLRRVVTLNLATQFLVPLGPGPLAVEGRVRQRDGKLVMGEAVALSADGTLAATAVARMRYLLGSEHPEGHPLGTGGAIYG